MNPSDYLQAARVPRSLSPQEFGTWTIRRYEVSALTAHIASMVHVGWDDYYTLLFNMTEATMHQPPGECVMEDSMQELSRHLPIWLAAHGRVLVTGLGLGCVVRGLLASPHVSHIDIVEIDAGIIRVIGSEFASEPRCTIHHADAMTWTPPRGAKWDYAWHDLWTENGKLQFMHAELLRIFARVHKAVPLERQGAWMFPRSGGRMLGSRRASRLLPHPGGPT